MTRINTNVESLRGQRNVQKANNMLSTSLQRLSTGIKINNGRDNPSGLIASEALRLQVTTIEQSIKNSNRANNVIATADSALGEIGGLLNQVRGLVQEGLNVGALSQAETDANQAQIDAALSAINRISANTTFAGDKLIDGSKAFNTSITQLNAGKLSDFKINEAILGSSQSLTIDATVNTAASKAQLRYTAGALSAAATVDVSGSKGQQTVSFGATSTVADLAAAINNATADTGVTARVLSGLTVANDAVANTLTADSVALNSDLDFTDARATSLAGTDASLGGSVSVVFANAGASQTLGVTVATNATTNAKTITVNLATDGASAITSTSEQVKTAIEQHAEASALVTVAHNGASTGLGLVSTMGATPLDGGTDYSQLALTDKRTEGAAGTVSVVFVDPAAASQALSVAVTYSGDNSTITVNLATNAGSALTSTLDDIKTALEASAAANALVSVDLFGDDDSVAAAFTSTALDATAGTLILESEDYGSAESVEVNVLAGAFATYAADGESFSQRDAGVDIDVTINGQSAVGRGLQATIRTSSLDASLNFAEDYNVADENAVVTVTGGGALFQIGQEVTAAGQIGVGIEAVNTARLGGVSGKLYELGTGNGKSLLDLRNSLTGAGAAVNQSDLVGIIEEAIDRVSSLRGRLGALQKNVIETNITTLGVALENVTEARSQIVDTDFAEETAQLQKAQILSQAGLSVLGIANQNPQQVLSLLR
ncbi:MAG: flagellin [Planctomycetaceae bacterium]|nr:flagellin [Planctomycetaceae bacterium]